MDLATFVQTLIDDGSIDALAQNPAAQFGTGSRQYLGATLLPERQVPENMGEEAQINYRTVIANDGTRYSPVQLKTTGQLVGSFRWELGHQDIGSQLDSVQYDALLRLLDRQADLDAVATVIRFLDNSVIIPLVEVIEKARWQALVDAQVVRVGDNGLSEEVDYPNPDGHRVNVGGDWWSESYDPLDDIMAMYDFMRDKGLNVSRIITARRVIMALLRNPLVQRRFAPYRALSDGDMFSRMNMNMLQVGLQSEGLPSIEEYDLAYNTQDGSRHRFLPEDAMVFVSETGVDEEVGGDIQQGGEPFRVLENTLGYTAVGRAAGQSNAGRALHVETFRAKPPRVEAEGWQASLPIITEPEAVGVLRGINPAE